MRARPSHDATRGWLSLVESFGWVILVLGLALAGGIMAGLVAGDDSLGARLVWALGALLFSVTSAALTVSVARIGKVVCDIADNTAREAKAPEKPGTLRRDPPLVGKRRDGE